MIFLKIFRKSQGLLKGTFLFFFDVIRYSKANKSKRFPVSFWNLYPCLSDRTSSTDFDRHYVYHVAWALRKVLEIKPSKHIDFSSSLFFCSNLSASIKTEFHDYRPANLKLLNLTTHFSNLTSLVHPDNSIECLSCMHVIEHVGLGRYGDPIDPDGDLKALDELKRVTKPGGHLLLVLPIGNERLLFNAHRVYSSKKIKSYFSDWNLQEFYFIPDKIYSETPILNPTDDVCNLQSYGCGCFLFKKEHI